MDWHIHSTGIGNPALDDRFYDTFSYVIYGVLILLFATIFNPHSIKGSHSWLVLDRSDCSLLSLVSLLRLWL